MTLTAYYPAFTDMFGDHKEWKSEWQPVRKENQNA